MKAIVNNVPTLRWGKDEHHVLHTLEGDLQKPQSEIITILQNHFMDILYAIQLAENSIQLRTNMQLVWFLEKDITNYYRYGFGANHMWVKQVDDCKITRGDNIIFVDLTSFS